MTANAPPDRSRLAFWLFVLWAVLGLSIAGWVWFIGAVAGHSLTIDPKSPLQLVAPLSGDGQHVCLLGPFVATAVSMILLTISAGMAQKGLWYGALIDERDRISLSRTQQIIWSILLLSALATITWFKASSGWSPEGETTPILFPNMNASLWGAMGISIAASPLLSAAIKQIKNEKAQGMLQAAAPAPAPVAGDHQPAAAAGQQQAGPDAAAPAVGARSASFGIIQAAPIDANPSPVDARWMDLISGETKGKQNSLDLSRLQHLMISGLLMTSYGVDLGHALANLSPGVHILGAMPDPGDAFLGLLGLSHASYLAFQARATS